MRADGCVAYHAEATPEQAETVRVAALAIGKLLTDLGIHPSLGLAALNVTYVALARTHPALSGITEKDLHEMVERVFARGVADRSHLAGMNTRTVTRRTDERRRRR